MPLTGTLLADFSSFTAAVADAEVSLKGFETGAGKVETALTRVTDSLSGVKIVQQATLAAEAVQLIGGVTKLTDDELQKLGATATEAAAKLRALGQDVPAGIQAIADAAAKARTTSDELGVSWVARIAEGELLADVIREGVAALKEMALAIPELAIRGSVVGDVEKSFEHLTESAQLSADVLMTTLRTGVHGTVDDFALMQRANKDMAAGLNLTNDQFGLLAQGAFALAKATGTDTKEALDKMSDALVTAKTKGVALLVGKLDLKAAEEAYAATLGGTAAQLDPETKLEVDREAILARIQTRLGDLGEQQDSLKDKVDQATTSWANFKDELGKSIAQSPVIAAALKTFGESLENAFGGTREESIRNISRLINELAIDVIDLGIGAVATGESLIKIFDAISVVILADATVVTGFFDLVVRGFTLQAELAAKFHVISPATLAEIEQFKAGTDAMTVSLAKLTVEQAKGAIGESDLQKGMEKTNGALFAARDAAIAAQTALDQHTDATHAATDATKTFVGPIQSALDALLAQNGALGLTKEYLKAYAEAVLNLSVVGTTWQETLADVDAGLVADAKAMLAAGASAKDLEIAWGILPTTMKAIQESAKADAEALKLADKVAADSAINWATYFKDVAALGNDSVAKAKAQTQAWLDDQIAKHALAKTDTEDFYNFVYAEADLKNKKIEQDALQADVHSRAHFEKVAADAQVAYDFATAHADQYTADWIEQLRKTAEAAKQAADTFGTAFDVNLKKTKDAIDAATFGFTAFRGQINLGISDLGELNKAVSKFYDDLSVGGGVGFAGSIGSGATGPLSAGMPRSLSVRDSGGPVVAGESYVIGLNKQPELFTPGASGFVTPIGAGGGGVAVTNVFHIVDTEANIAQRVSAAVTRSLMQASKLGAVV